MSLVRTGSRVQLSSRAPPFSDRRSIHGTRRQRDHHTPVHRVQTSQLHDDEEQENDDREPRAQEVLPARPKAHGPSRSEVRRSAAPGGAHPLSRGISPQASAISACCGIYGVPTQANSSISRASISNT